MPTVLTRRRIVLIVDDDDTALQALSLCLEGLSPSPWILQAHNGKEAIAHLGEHGVDLVITDLEMPVMDGFSFLARLANQRPRIPAVVVTAHGSAEAGARLREQGIYRIISKPIDFAAMQKLVAHQLDGHGSVRGFALPAVLQLIELERKSCTVRLTKNILDSDVEGALYFENGRLMDAASESLFGDDAVRELLTWIDPLIDIERPAQIAAPQVGATISEFLRERALTENQDRWLELSELASGETSKVGKHELEHRHIRLLASLRQLPGAVAAALFTWPDISLVSAAANEDNEPLDAIIRGASEAFAIHVRLEAAYGAGEHESLFWLGRRFLLLHGIGPDHCAVIAADPDLTTAQILRQQLRSLLPPPPKV